MNHNVNILEDRNFSIGCDQQFENHCSKNVLEHTGLYNECSDDRPIGRSMGSVNVQAHMEQLILQNCGNTCILEKSLLYLYQPCEAINFSFKMGLIPRTPQQCNLCMGSRVTLLHSPTPWGLGAMAFTLCSNSQIYIESVPQNYLLTDQ